MERLLAGVVSLVLTRFTTAVALVFARELPVSLLCAEDAHWYKLSFSLSLSLCAHVAAASVRSLVCGGT